MRGSYAKNAEAGDNLGVLGMPVAKVPLLDVDRADVKVLGNGEIHRDAGNKHRIAERPILRFKKIKSYTLNSYTYFRRIKPYTIGEKGKKKKKK